MCAAPAEHVPTRFFLDSIISTGVIVVTAVVDGCFYFSFKYVFFCIVKLRMSVAFVSYIYLRKRIDCTGF
jgi:hypothetical protein